MDDSVNSLLALGAGGVLVSASMSLSSILNGALVSKS